MEQFYSRDEIIDALFSITDQNDYNVWVGVGMVLKENGFDVGVFEDWSRQFPKYSPGCCQDKWDKLEDEPRKSGPIKSIGSIIHEAKKNGWRKRGEPLSWDSPIGGKFISPKKRTLPRYHGSPAEQLRAYLKAVFNDSDIVGYVTRSKLNSDGTKMVPKDKGTFTKTAGDILSGLPDIGDIEWAVGTSDPEGGAWIRLNPLDGNGVEDKNVTAFRFALIESDEGTPEEQYAIIKALKLPTAAIVYSGKKSVHAVVHVDAPNRDVFRSRVETLLEVCRSNGLVVDEKNKNPSRLSRMPGVMRGDQEQYLVEIGGETSSWFEWLEVVKRLNRAKEIKRLGDYSEKIDKVKLEPVIERVLNRGEVGMIASSTKVGKTWAMMGLTFCVMSGTPYLGMDCRQGKTLYIDNELREKTIHERTRRLCSHHDEASTSKWMPYRDDFMYITNRLEGATVEKVLTQIDLACEQQDIALVIVDPLRAIIGNESDVELASSVAHQFLACAERNNVGIILVHHFPKGDASSKAAIDRFSGSGAWASTIDTVMTVTALEKDDRVRAWLENNLSEIWPNCNSIDSENPIEDASPARIEFTFRDHRPRAPVNYWWRPFAQVLDPIRDGILKNTALKSNDPNAKRKEEKRGKITLLEEAVVALAKRDELPADPEMFTEGKDAIAATAETVRNYAKKSHILEVITDGKKHMIDLKKEYKDQTLDF